MNIKLRERQDVVIIDIEGTIDIDAAEIIETAGWLVKDNKLKLVCNFERVDFVDYNGLSVLAIMYKEVINFQGQVRFACVALHIIELFRVVKLDEVFQIYENVEAAFDSFKSESQSPILKKPLRRRFKRLSIDICVEYTLLGTSKQAQNSFVGKVANISGAGLFISTTNIFPVGTQLDLNIYMRKEFHSVVAKGIVVWIADKDLQPLSYPGIGIQFHPIDTKVQGEIVGFIEKNITRRSEEQT